MKNTKRLIRGLKDISEIFLSATEKSAARTLERPEAKEKNPAVACDAPAASGFAERVLLEGPPPPEPTKRKTGAIALQSSFALSFHGFSMKPEGPPSVTCLTILPSDGYERLVKSQAFMGALGEVFSEVCILFFSDDVASREPSPLARHFIVPPFQLRDILHPEPVLKSQEYAGSGFEGRTCFLLDPNSMFELGPDVFRLLDQIVLTLSADSSDSILAAYELMSACLERNPLLRFSLFIEGAIRDEMLEMVYERFGSIASQFLGCEIDFLGWQEGERVQLNPDLLSVSAERTPITQLPLKMRLIQSLSEALLFEAA